MRAATSALPWVLALSVASCNAISGIGDLTRGSDTVVGGGDGGTLPCGGADLTSDANNCGTCGHACGTGNFCGASACVQGCTGGLLYVSPTGNDTNDGCSPDKPLATITKGAALAKAQGNALVKEVHVCKGTYKEPQITVDFKSSVRGSYSCTNWERTPTFGFPIFDKTNLSEIDSTTTTGASVTTLTVGGAAVDASVIVDGFLIQGSSAPLPTIALALGAGSPTIKDDVISGGAPSESAAPNASIGIQIGGGGAPEITSCNVSGGGGISTSTSTSSIGSTGIVVAADSGNANIHGVTVDGGSGSATIGNGSIAIAVNGGAFAAASANTIRSNTISGGAGKIGTSGVASVGIVSVASGNVELDANQILGGTGSCAKATGTCSIAGIVAGVGSLIVSGNKIYGGDATGNKNGGSVGITVSGLKSFVAQNNMIDGGNKTADSGHGSAVGVELTQIAGPQLLNNSIYSGNVGSGAGEGAYAVVIQPNVSAIVAQNNLIMTSGVQDAGFVVSCTPELVSKFQNNVFLTQSAIVKYGGGGSGTCGGVAMTYTQVGGLGGAESFFIGSATSPTVNGNKSVTLDCGTDSECTSDAVCNSASNCEAAIVTGWTKTDNGFTTLTTDGWKVGTKCAVSQGGLDISATLKTDFYGAARTAPLSAGAHEQDATCAP